MSKLKLNPMVILMFLLLCVVAVMPFLAIQIKNNNIINKANIADLSLETLNSANENTDDTFEKIRVMSSGSSINTVYQIESFPKEEISKLIDIIENQLEIMGNFKAVPKIVLDGDFDLLVERQSYIDTENVNLIVSVWDISIDSKQWYLNVRMDTKTATVYEIIIQAKNADAYLYDDEDDDNIIAEGFFKYLGINPVKVSVAKGLAGQIGEYIVGNNNFIYSFQNTNNIISYRLSPYLDRKQFTTISENDAG